MARVVVDVVALPWYWRGDGCFAEGILLFTMGFSKLSRDLLLPARSNAGPPEVFLVVEDSRILVCEVSRVFYAELYPVLIWPTIELGFFDLSGRVAPGLGGILGPCLSTLN